MSSLISEILSGEYDNDIEALSRVIDDRRRYVATSMGRTLQPGDIVRFKSYTKPKYLIGLTGTVVDTTYGTVRINLGPEAGRYSGITTAPFTIIEKI